MRPRPIYRWKCFWFGLLVLVFIAWAAGDSFSRQFVVVYSGRAMSCGFIRHNATSSVFWNTSTNVPGFRVERVYLPDWDKAESGFGRIRRDGGRVLHVADIAVVGSLILVGIAFLGWRRTKQRKCLTDVS